MSVQLNGITLINARHKRGLSQQDIVFRAKAIGHSLSLRTVSKAENGLPVHPGTAKALSEVLNIAMGKLVIERKAVYSDLPQPSTKKAIRQLVKSARTHPRRKRA